MTLPAIITADFDKRWAAWRERGRLHDQRSLRRLRIALPLLALAAFASYLLLTG